jgi:hypothetical protein
MTQDIINALNAKFTADKLKAFANLANYMGNSDTISGCSPIPAELPI